MKYIKLIGEHYEELTKSEKKVADFIMAQGEKVTYSTMSDIKQFTKVGDATIIRFCQKIGYSGFSELKIAIAKEDFSQKNVQENIDDAFATIANQVKATIDETSYSLVAKQIAAVAKQLLLAKQIYLFGVGASGQSSLDLEKMLLKVGVPAKAVTDPHFQVQAANILSTEDVVVAFSLSGKTKDTHDSVVIAKNKGAKIIVITSFPKSPIAQLGEVVIQTAIEEHVLNGGSLAGRISQLFISEVLTKEIEKQLGEKNLTIREEVLRAVMDKML